MRAGFLTNWWNAFTGAGDHSVTVPPWDGPLHPNTSLETAARILDVDQPDNLCVYGDRLIFSSGNSVLEMTGGDGAVSQVAGFGAAVTAMSADKGGFAVALADGTIEIHGRDGSKTALRLPDAAGTACITAMLLEGRSLLVANGSSHNGAAEWKRDLMERRASGSVWRIGDGAAAERLVSGLAFPYGLARRRNGSLVCSESWRHRIIEIGQRGDIKPLLSELPAYPARLVSSPDGGFWLAAFAPRTQMVEFMLREPKALKEMITTIDPEYWMAPRYASGRSFKEPLQGGGIKQLGILKPWAPTQSYGLVVRLDMDMRPTGSFHSRADGTIHGVTSCAVQGNRLLAASRGADCIVGVDLTATVEAAA